VVSPNDTYYEVERKVREYLQAGVPLVWVVNPPTRMVRVHHPGGSLTDLEEQQDLAGEDVLPGVRCRVGGLFPPPEGARRRPGARRPRHPRCPSPLREPPGPYPSPGRPAATRPQRGGGRVFLWRLPRPPRTIEKSCLAPAVRNRTMRAPRLFPALLLALAG